MKRIDFYNMKKALHNEMLEAIVNLFKESGITEIDFEGDGNQSAYVILSPDGASSTYETLVQKVKCENEQVYVTTEDYDSWLSCRHAGMVVTGTLSDLYDAVFDYIGSHKS